MKKGILALTLLFLTLTAFSQNEEMSVLRERNYEGTALYGFMNGGSDLFLEYGFQKLNVRDVKFQNTNYTIEIYSMDTPKNAFGIYSIHVFKPLRVDSLLCGQGFDCLSKYQLQAVYHRKYISIVFNSGPAAASGAEKLLQSIVAATAAEEAENNDFGFPAEVLKLPKPFSGHLQYARGELGLSNADEEMLSEYTEIGQEYGLWIYTASGKETVYIKDSDFD